MNRHGVTTRMLEDAFGVDSINRLIRQISQYAIEYGVTAEQSMDDYDEPLADDLRELVSEAAAHIIDSYNELIIKGIK